MIGVDGMGQQSEPAGPAGGDAGGIYFDAQVTSARPVVALYLAFQRYLVHGLAAGAVSGV